MINQSLIGIGKSISRLSKALKPRQWLNLAWTYCPEGNPNFHQKYSCKFPTKVIIVAGTKWQNNNSKSYRDRPWKKMKKLLFKICLAQIFLNGVASAILLYTNAQGKLTQNFAIFEVDENALPSFWNKFTPDYLVLLNLFAISLIDMEKLTP